MCVYVCIYMHVCMYLCIHMTACQGGVGYVKNRLIALNNTYLYLYLYLHLYVCVCVCMYVCMYIYMTACQGGVGHSKNHLIALQIVQNLSADKDTGPLLIAQGGLVRERGVVDRGRRQDRESEREVGGNTARTRGGRQREKARGSRQREAVGKRGSSSSHTPPWSTLS